MPKAKRKCTHMPSIGVRYGACETCRRCGGKCYAREKYDRNTVKRREGSCNPALAGGSYIGRAVAYRRDRRTTGRINGLGAGCLDAEL